MTDTIITPINTALVQPDSIAANAPIKPEPVALVLIPASITTNSDASVVVLSTLARMLQSQTIAASASMPIIINPAIRDPLIAQAVAAYRVGETVEHSVTELDPALASETIPGVLKILPVQPIGSGSHAQ